MIEILSDDWPGFLLIFISFLLLYRFWKIKQNKKESIALGIVLLLHHFVAIINIYFFAIPGAEGDPARSYRIAAEWASNGKWVLSIGANFYTQFLGIFYRIFGPSKLLGEELSIIFFFLSCFILIKIVELLNINNKYTVPILLVYGLLPTNLIFCSKILRESYQLYFFMASVYWGLRFHIKPVKSALPFCLISAILMGLFQRALIVYALVLLPIILLWFPQHLLGFSTKKLCINKGKLISVGVALIFILGIIVIGIIFDVGDMGAAKYFLKGQGFEFAAHYRARLMFRAAPHARANYGIILDTSSPISLIKSASVIYIYYLFAPFPWMMTNWLDLYALGESFLRFILICFSLFLWYRETDIKKRRIWSLLLFIYFSMTFLWAMGTINYGQAIRHHVITNWIIIILGIYGFMKFFVENFYRKIANRKAG